MASNLRELRQRRKSVTATMKITKAMELIAASRVIKAQQAAARALPYTRELNRATSAVATRAHITHPLTKAVTNSRRAALLVFGPDRGMNGAYSANVLKMAGRMDARLQEQGQEVTRFVIGRKALGYFNFRGIEVAHSWQGFSDAPEYRNAQEIAEVILSEFLKPYAEGGFDEIHVVYTRMNSMLSQAPKAVRILPIEVVPGVSEATENMPEYLFEPNPKAVLDKLLPLYLKSRIWFYLLQSAASQLASQQRAMKSATDNARDLIVKLTREANQARQAEITNEITEIVGGAAALAEKG